MVTYAYTYAYGEMYKGLKTMSNLEKLSESVDLALNYVQEEQQLLQTRVQLCEKVDPSSYHAALDLYEDAMEKFHQELR